MAMFLVWMAAMVSTVLWSNSEADNRRLEAEAACACLCGYVETPTVAHLDRLRARLRDGETLHDGNPWLDPGWLVCGVESRDRITELKGATDGE